MVVAVMITSEFESTVRCCRELFCRSFLDIGLDYRRAEIPAPHIVSPKGAPHRMPRYGLYEIEGQKPGWALC